jgi:hypothetical protein
MSPRKTPRGPRRITVLETVPAETPQTPVITLKSPTVTAILIDLARKYDQEKPLMAAALRILAAEPATRPS